MKAVAIEVSDTPVQVVGKAGEFAALSGFVLNAGPDQVFLGGPDVDDVDGFPLTTDDAGFSLSDLPTGEKLYAICSSGNSATLNLIRTGT